MDQLRFLNDKQQKLTLDNFSRNGNLVAHIIRKFKGQTGLCMAESSGLHYVNSTHSLSHNFFPVLVTFSVTWSLYGIRNGHW